LAPLWQLCTTVGNFAKLKLLLLDPDCPNSDW
jgi:hypothetical protein